MRLVKNWVTGAGMVICLELGANIRIRSSWCRCCTIISCFIKIQDSLTFLVPVYPGFPEKEPLNGWCLSIYLSHDLISAPQMQYKHYFNINSSTCVPNLPNFLLRGTLTVKIDRCQNFNKCLAVAEMGDRFARIDMGRGLRMQACLAPCKKHTTVSYS